MKIFVDENIPLDTIEALSNMGHDVLDIRGTDKEGIPDEEIWEIVLKEKRLLITTDKGFSQYRDETHYGILMICLKKPNRERINGRILGVMSQIKENEWIGLMVMVKDNVQSIWRPKEIESIN
jgi:predicted nuclease of predicted toxin-antitoxin system